jgi:hypothetical protein
VDETPAVVEDPCVVAASVGLHGARRQRPDALLVQFKPSNSRERSYLKEAVQSSMSLTVDYLLSDQRWAVVIAREEAYGRESAIDCSNYVIYTIAYLIKIRLLVRVGCDMTTLTC